jgi:hypothetical protein
MPRDCDTWTPHRGKRAAIPPQQADALFAAVRELPADPSPIVGPLHTSRGEHLQVRAHQYARFRKATRSPL